MMSRRRHGQLLSANYKDMRDSITNEVVQQVKQALHRFPQDLNCNDGVTQFLLVKRMSNVGIVQRRHEEKENKRRRVISQVNTIFTLFSDATIIHSSVIQ